MHTAVSTLELDAVKELIDTRLADYCKIRTIEATRIGASYGQLWHSIETLLQAGGKRFRPYMLIATYNAYSGNSDFEAILPAALAQELVHQAMLIHDDIIDRDTVRYGINNVAGRYNELYAIDIPEQGERSHMSLSAALLAGDALLSDSYQLINKLDAPGEVIGEAVQILANGIFEVIGGELLDTESPFLPEGSVSAEVIARYKTASYSFISPITMGAVIARAPVHEIQQLKLFAEYLGVGYQLRDDLLGVFGDAAKTGKSTTTDIEEGKQTYLIEQFESVATAEQKVKFSALFHRPNLADDEFAQIKLLLTESGAKAKVEAKIDEFFKKSQLIVHAFDIPDTSKELFIDLIHRCLEREV